MFFTHVIYMYDTYILYVKKYMYITHELKCGIRVVYIYLSYIYNFTHVTHLKSLTCEKHMFYISDTCVLRYICYTYIIHMKYICLVQHMFNMCGKIGCVHLGTNTTYLQKI